MRNKLGALAIAVGTLVSTAAVATPAVAAAPCATNYRIVSVSIKYKGCARLSAGAGKVAVNGRRLNDHGSAVTVQFQYGLRDVTAGTVTYESAWHTKTWPAGSGTIIPKKTFACIRGHKVRALLHVKVNNTTGPWSESPTATCPR